MPDHFFTWLKRILSIAIIFSFLAGCAGQSLTPGREPVTLQFVFIEGAADYQSLADDFHQKHPNITVELDPVSRSGNMQNDFASKLTQADAIRIPLFSISSDLANALLPLDSYLTTDRSFPISDLYPGSLDALKQDGRQVGIPAGLDPFVMYYYPTKFESAGVQIPNPDWTLDDFVQTAAAVNRTDPADLNTEQFAYGFCSIPESTDPAVVSYLFGGGLFDSLTQISQPTLNQQANVDALTWYASLNSDYGILPPAKNGRDLAMLIARAGCGYWIDWLSRSNYGDFGNTPAAMLPLPTHSTPFNIASLESYSIVAKSEHPEETWQWLSFLMSQPSASGKLIPPVKKQAVGAEVSAETRNIASHLPEQTVMLGMEMYRNERFGKVLDLYSQAARKVVDGTETASDALNTAQSQAEEIFK